MVYDSPSLAGRFRPGRLLACALAGALLLVPSLVLVLLLSAPALMAPAQDFTQGPGGAGAYVSLWNQLQDQYPEFWSGAEIQLTMSEAEFSGMVSSALLSGRGPADPLQKVRAGLDDGEIRVETVLNLPWPEIPERYRGPVGLGVSLRPVVLESGLIRFRISRAQVGQIPVPLVAIRWAGRLVPAGVQGFDPLSASISLPVGDMVAASLGRRLAIRNVTAEVGRLTLTLALAPAGSRE